MSCSDWIMYIAYTSPPPGGCPITQSRKFFSIFTQSRTYFPAFTQSYKLVTFFQFHAITHRFFPISRNHANKKGLFTPSRTPKRPFTHHAHMSASRNHAIIFSFSRNHAESRNKKRPFTQSRKPMGGLIKDKYLYPAYCIPTRGIFSRGTRHFLGFSF